MVAKMQLKITNYLEPIWGLNFRTTDEGFLMVSGRPQPSQADATYDCPVRVQRPLQVGTDQSKSKTGQSVKDNGNAYLFDLLVMFIFLFIHLFWVDYE